jgi:tetratricopeptide (TPR) repeat protein
VPFHFDDFSPVASEVVRQSADQEAQNPRVSVQVAGRPVVRASFAVNYSLGGLDVKGYHALNIAVHVLCALLLFAIVRRTLERWSDDELKGSATGVALAASVIWALHPLNAGVVTYISARSESLMVLCYLGMLLAGLRVHDSRHRAVWHCGAVGACALGMATKESMVTAPVMFVLFDRAFVFASLKEAWNARWRLYVALFATWGVLAALASSAPRAESVGLSLGVSPWTYLLNQAEIITDYLRRAFWPDQLVFAYGEPRAITLVDVMPQALLVTVLVGFAFWAWHARPKVGFLGLGFFVLLAPTSSVVPIATEVAAERRMYLPLACLVVLVVVSARRAWSELGKQGEHGWPPRTGVVAGVVTVMALAVPLGITTMRRNAEYASAELLWRTTLDRWPSAVAHRNLATALKQAGKREEAVTHLRATLTDHPEGRYAVGLELFEMGRDEEALAELRTFLDTAAVEGSDVEANARYVMGRALTELGRREAAVRELTHVLGDQPNHADAQLALADLLLGRQAFEEALRRYQQFVSLRPGHAGAWANLGIAAMATGNIRDGVDAFERVIELQPESAVAHLNLARALTDSGRGAEAAPHAAKAVSLAPGDARAREVYGRALLAQGRDDDAVRELERASQLDPGNHDVQETLMRLRRAGRASAKDIGPE